MALLIIARLSLREAARRRLIISVALITAALVPLTGWGASRIASPNNGQLLPPGTVALNEAVFVMLMAWGFSMVLAVGGAFLAAPAIAADIESGSILALLTRPIRRSDILLGKWLALAALLTAYTSLTAASEFAMIHWLTGYAPPHPVLAVLFLIGESLVLMTLALLGSTRFAPMTGGIIAISAFGIAWIAGMASMIAAALNNRALVTAGTVVSLLLPTDGLWRDAVFYLQPAAIVALANAAANGGKVAGPFGVTAPQPPAYLVWAAGWLIAMLLLAVWSFNRRDL